MKLDARIKQFLTIAGIIIASTILINIFDHYFNIFQVIWVLVVGTVMALTAWGVYFFIKEDLSLLSLDSSNLIQSNKDDAEVDSLFTKKQEAVKIESSESLFGKTEKIQAELESNILEEKIRPFVGVLALVLSLSSFILIHETVTTSFTEYMNKTTVGGNSSVDFLLFILVMIFGSAFSELLNSQISRAQAFYEKQLDIVNQRSNFIIVFLLSFVFLTLFFQFKENVLNSNLIMIQAVSLSFIIGMLFYFGFRIRFSKFFSLGREIFKRENKNSEK